MGYPAVRVQSERSPLADTVFVKLTIDDRLHAAGFEECDDAVFPVPDAIAGAPDFVSVDLDTAGQDDDGFNPQSLEACPAARGDAAAAGGAGGSGEKLSYVGA